MYAEIFINAHRNFFVKGILVAVSVVFKIVNSNGLCHRVDDPIFPYAGIRVFKKLNPVIFILGAFRNNFNDPVGGTVTTLVCELAFVANNAYVRLNIIIIIFI